MIMIFWCMSVVSKAGDGKYLKRVSTTGIQVKYSTGRQVVLPAMKKTTFRLKSKANLHQVRLFKILLDYCHLSLLCTISWFLGNKLLLPLITTKYLYS